MQMGLKFSSVFSVGNSAQIGVEDLLKHLDETYIHGISAPVKLLYIENISKPDLLLKHSKSLISKGARIAAVKSGSSEAGSRAASSHTGAMASPDVAVSALFNKAGIIRCNSRSELVTVGSILMYPRPKGKRVAIITHAGGPAVDWQLLCRGETAERRPPAATSHRLPPAPARWFGQVIAGENTEHDRKDRQTHQRLRSGDWF